VEAVPVLGSVLLLAVAVGVTLASHRLRVPSVVGLLLSGILIGPSGLGLFRHSEQVQTLAEIGVVALLFTTGLDSRSRGCGCCGGCSSSGSLQSIGTILLTFLVARARPTRATRSLSASWSPQTARRSSSSC
jgi:CPA2 family monovalent cation:H+ antiporter-2